MDKRIWLSLAHMGGQEQQFIQEAFDTKAQLKVISYLHPFQGHEWSGPLPSKKRGSCKKRDEIIKHIRTTLKEKQGLHCAFCGLPLNCTSAPEIDHIAPKKKHPEYIFEAKNLVLSCSLCNGFTKKGDIDTISNKGESYEMCIFKIVHPYFDDPLDHYTFLEYNGYPCLIQLNTPKAEESNSIFLLNSPEMTQERYKEAMYASQPLPPKLEEMLELIKKENTLQTKHLLTYVYHFSNLITRWSIQY